MSYWNHSLDIDDSIKDENLQWFCLLRSIWRYLKSIEPSSKLGAICSTQMGSISRFPRTEFPGNMSMVHPHFTHFRKKLEQKNSFSQPSVCSSIFQVSIPKAPKSQIPFQEGTLSVRVEWTSRCLPGQKPKLLQLKPQELVKIVGFHL